MNDAQKVLTKHEVKRMIDYLARTGGSMRLDALQNLVGSVSQDMLGTLLTQKIGAKLVEKFYTWPDRWKNWVDIGQSGDLDTQVREKMAQLPMIPALKDTGNTFVEIKLPTASELTYRIEGYGGIVTVDFRTLKSDHLNYFDRLGERLGRAAVSRLHQFIYVTMLQANPTVADGHSLFDDTNHGNDLDAAGTGNALNYDNVVAALRKADEMADESGEPLAAEKFYIVCGNYWREIADQLIQNPNKPGTANNEVNTLKSRIAGVDASRKLGYDWYLVADKGEIPGLYIAFFEGQEEPRITKERNDSSYQFEHPGKQRWRVDHYYGGVWEYPQAVIRGSTNTV